MLTVAKRYFTHYTLKGIAMKNTKAANAKFNMQAAVSNEEMLGLCDDALIDLILGDIIEGETLEADATQSQVEEVGAGHVVESEVEAAVASIEKIESIHAMYADDAPDAAAEASAADMPKTDPEAVVGKMAKVGKPPKAPKPPKPPKAYAPTFASSKRSEVLASKLGEKMGEFLLLEVSDVELDAEALTTKQSDLLKLLDTRPGTGESSTQKKVAEKIVQLFAYMRGGGALNEVMRRAFEALMKDGALTSGDKGNLHASLLEKPYSVGTCRAQAGQIFAMFPMLKITIKDGKGRQVANPDSLILMKISAMLSIVK
jgi:hypothetical protein